MKKIMFNDKFGLTQAVLDGRKTMTRRIANPLSSNIDRRIFGTLSEGSCIIERKLVYTEGQRIFVSQYKLGEVVAIAQRYADIGTSLFSESERQSDWYKKNCGNKMFVKAELMPHHIRITDIKVERLQDISDEDCMKEGIFETPSLSGFDWNGFAYQNPKPNGEGFYLQPRDAFSALIDKVSGKVTWKSNPFVFAYTFELVD